jgi:tRNA A37 threonylcarbamoyladenosine synthetase subunit TsaC/SUA5/YrdC
LENDELPMTEAYDVAEAFACHVDCVIDGGPVYPEPSTIISLVGDQPEVLRHGKGRADAFLF